MEEYPEYHFSQSQPQLYEFVKEHYPSLYEKIRRRVKEGRWEPIGGAWVQMDANIPSGESLVRQFLYGNRFFRKEFGVHTRICWLPDTFGFSWSLPQIIAKADIDYFATTKINWSQYNSFPYNLFMWQGVDGTRVLAAMIDYSYNGGVTPKNMVEYWNRFRQKDLCDILPYSFGHGDGGGGPTKEMLENGRRMKDIVGIPKCEFGRIHDAMDRIRRSVDTGKLPVWNNELYLEYHRGCQTSQARTKRNNRKSELVYRDSEFLSSIAMFDGLPYPQDKLYEGWKVLLCHQFHDILPGSSINDVYRDADENYSYVLKTGREVLDGALKVLRSSIDTSGEGDAIIIFNTLSWERTDVASVTVDLRDGEDFVILDESGREVRHQLVPKDGGGTEVIFEAEGIPPMGYAVYRLIRGRKPGSAWKNELKASKSLLENRFYRIRIDGKGTLSRIYDKLARRDVLARGARGNVLQMFDDRPHGNEAWDIDFNFEEKMWELDSVDSIEVLESGPVRALVRIVKSTEKSRIVQDVAIYRNIPRIDFISEVDWWEKRVLMKSAFPVDVLAHNATYEIQYAAIDRPTHFSTSWDRAKFEVPAQRWVDLSEGDYGVSLLNDCKYGFDIHDNVIRISLLRAPISPDPHADEGKHYFTYSLLPHRGDWRQGGAVPRAYELNVPLIALVEPPHGGERPPRWSFVSSDSPNVIIDAVKKAEDGDEIVIRLYEAYGQRGDVELQFFAPPEKIAECNLMEEKERPLRAEGAKVRFYIRPFEIRTFKVAFGDCRS